MSATRSVAPDCSIRSSSVAPEGDGEDLDLGVFEAASSELTQPVSSSS
ncbi:hypothetical protein Q6348_08145 [Isoptericola sp. b441]|uniref:Uncharacterized protein n=1 Tax=Actinotalea lenta TaxID=3064654 RepID=A0ABT9D8E2_9CELL|nr:MULTISPECIES: hypothetical protein [unclassified Isoptericola]MDO8107165.1 hypothetical protein [Isoptericola sp. b441]MDO8121149.1 hypothetical protein [Isoptericola sp. b490]